MAAITGPNIQMADVPMFVDQQSQRLNPSWVSFFHSVQQIAFNTSRSGPTASRPTSTLDGRWIGMQYFDTTLGLTIYLKSVNPDVWVNGAGAAV